MFCLIYKNIDIRWTSESLNNFKKKNETAFKIIILLFPMCLLFSLLVLLPFSWGDESAEDIKFSLNIEEKTIEEACKEIYEQTDYKIILSGKIPQKKITVIFKNNTLSEAIELLVKRADITAHAVISDLEKRMINIKIFESNGKTISKSSTEIGTSNDNLKAEIEPGFSYKDMESAISMYNEGKKNLQLTEEIEPGFSYQRMEDAVKNYENQKKEMFSKDEVEPGFSYKDMENSIKKYKEWAKHIKQDKKEE